MYKVKTYILTLGFSINKCLFLIGALLLFHSFNYSQQNAKDSIVQRIKSIKSTSSFSNQDTLYIDLLNGLAQELRFYRSDSLLKISKQALKHSKAINYTTGECQALISLGDYYSDKGAHEKGLRHYQTALDLGTVSNNQDLILDSKNNLAGEYAYKGDYAMALTHYLEGIDLAKIHENKSMLSILNENVANLYASQKDYVQALEFYKEIKKINEEIGDEIFSAETLSNIASIYADMGELDYAMYNVNSSITIFEKHQIMDWLAYAYEIKGKTYLKRKKFKWALYWYNQSELLHNDLEDQRGEIDLFNGMAEAYLGLNKGKLSEVYALKAFETSESLMFMEGKQKCANMLYKINKTKQDFAMALNYHEIYQTLSDTLSRSENKKSLSMLKTKMEHEKQKEDLIEKNRSELATQRNYMYVALAILLIFVVITYLVHRSDKIHKALNIELKKKTADLERNGKDLIEINRTKDTLFSIIGHDLRGPIGAFQGFLTLFKDGEITEREFMDFVPRLRHDIDHISFTLNNLLTWGQTQMNGSVSKPEDINLESIVDENINLLSEIAENKSIKLVSHLTTNTIVRSDSNQIDIVVRNLISNALKFTPDNGMVTVMAQEKNEHWQISVRDTGVGMDKETVAKLFGQKSNFTTYGTNNEKGTGLGLSLCKEMVEKNDGNIWVDTSLQMGSTFHFTVPKSKKKYKKTA